jgi:glycosyltransferase involved in cell wall biosynthesis
MKSVSVVICTFNSEKYLSKIDINLSNQRINFNDLMIERIVVDGGSEDNTIEMAKKKGFRVIQNLAGNAIDGKFLGLINSNSQFIAFLDHDELMIRNDSFYRKIQAFENSPSLIAVLSSGYLIDDRSTTANSYASEFGDPWSKFFYNTSNTPRYRTKKFSRELNIHKESDLLTEYYIDSNINKILSEWVTSGTIIDREKLIRFLPDTLVDKNVLPNAVYYFSEFKSHKFTFAVLHNDPIEHDSSEKWKKVFLKIRWRVANACEVDNEIESGFILRENISGFKFRNSLKKLIFLVSILTIIPIFISAITLAISRRRLGYLMHFILTYYVVSLIIYFKILKIMKYKGSYDRRYDGSVKEKL